MIQVRRQDVGVDVVYLPSKELVVLHPDLDYAESLGAVRAVLPDLHIDVAVGLVQSVTPRPRPQAALRTRLAMAVVGLAASLVGILGLESTPASAMFGPTFSQTMSRMGLTCASGEGQTRVCTSKDGSPVEVVCYRRHGAALYIVRRPGHDAQYLLIFDTREHAQAWAEKHPDTPVTGRVAAL